MGKTSFTDAKRGTAFTYTPEDFFIAWHDKWPGKDGTPEKFEGLRCPKLLQDPSEELIADIEARGVHTPIKVWKDPDSDLPIVIFGRTRVRAARIANERRIARGLPEIRIEFLRIRGDVKDLALVMASENAQRTDLTPPQQGEQMQRLVKIGCSVDEIAVAMAMKPAMVKKRLDLLEMSPRVVKAVNDGKLNMTAALKLRSAGGYKDQNAALKQLLDGEETEPDEPKNKPARMPPKKGAAKGADKPKPKPKPKPKRKTAREAARAVGEHVTPSVKEMKALSNQNSLEDVSAADFVEWWLGRKDPSGPLKDALVAVGIA